MIELYPGDMANITELTGLFYWIFVLLRARAKCSRQNFNFSRAWNYCVVGRSLVSASEPALEAWSVKHSNCYLKKNISKDLFNLVWTLEVSCLKKKIFKGSGHYW